MKKITIILFTIFIFNIYNVSCLKNKSSTYDVATTIDNNIYYYRLCDHSYVCKFSCETDNVSSLTQQNIPFTCKKPVAIQGVNELINTYKKRKDVYNNIITPILEGNKLNIIPVQDDLLKVFDSVFSGPENSCILDENKDRYDPEEEQAINKKTDFCKKTCESSCSYGAALVPWLITKEGSNFIYQKKC